MHIPHKAFRSGVSSAVVKGTKLRIVPRKDACAPAREDDWETTVAPEPPAGAGSRIHPSEPKVPFAHPLKTVVADGPGEPLEKPKGSRRFRGFFKSRRLGRHRIVIFIVLPLSFLLTVAFVYVLLRIH
ncbi:MAG: hypothetical protein WCS31_10445 [Verrucomicrobiae bacterium]